MTTNRRKVRRKALQVEVRRRLVPRLLELGYESTRTRAGKAAWGEDWKYYGFGRRRSGFVDLVMVDWEKYGAPIFKLQYSRCRQDEVDLGSRATSLRNGVVSPTLTGLERLFGRYRHWFGEWQSIDAAIDQVAKSRGQIGSFQRNILESNIRSLGVAKESLSATESTIRDTDVAAEMTQFSKLQILQQAGMSVLAQANQAPQAVLNLLRGG